MYNLIVPNGENGLVVYKNLYNRYNNVENCIMYEK